MTVFQRLSREPNVVLGVITAGLSLAVLFGLEVSSEQMAGVGVFAGALIGLIRFLTTPAGEVVVQEKPNGEVVAGAAAATPTGTRIAVNIVPTEPHYFDE